MNFSSFALRHKFSPRDIFPSFSRGASPQDFELCRRFGGGQVLNWHLGNEGMAKLNGALAMAQYMSEGEVDPPVKLSELTSKLSDEAWYFALRFAPYHKVHVALENLERVNLAMLEACLNLNAAMAGMESAFELHGPNKTAYARERSRSTSALLTFSALYASYIDVCRRIRNYSGLKDSPAYSRAVRRIIINNVGAHGFAKGLRNFMLHYHLVEPNIAITLGEGRTVKLLLDSSYLLFSGFRDWSPDARDYIRKNEGLDVISAATSVVRDAGRVILFHRKLAERRLVREKLAYEAYLHERARFRHLQNAVVDIAAAFRRPTPILERVLDKDVVSLALSSSLEDVDVRHVLLALADRHRNLPSDTKKALLDEVEVLLVNRRKIPNCGASPN